MSILFAPVPVTRGAGNTFGSGRKTHITLRLVKRVAAGQPLSTPLMNSEKSAFIARLTLKETGEGFSKLRRKPLWDLACPADGKGGRLRIFGIQ